MAMGMWGRGGGLQGQGAQSSPSTPEWSRWGAHPQPSWHTWLRAAPKPNLSLLRGSKLPALGAPQCSWDCQALAGCLQAPAGVIPCTIRDVGTHPPCWSWQGRVEQFFFPSCLQKEKGSGGRAASPRHTQGTQRCAERDSTRRAAGTGRARRHPAPRARQHRPAPCQRSPGALSKVCGTQGTRVALLRAARGQAGAPAAPPGPVRGG